MPVAEEYRLQAAKCARLARGLNDDVVRNRLLELEREFRDAANEFEIRPSGDRDDVAALLLPAGDRGYADDQAALWPAREDDAELRLEAAKYVRRLGDKAVPFLCELAEMAALDGDDLSAEAWSDIAEAARRLLAV
jgi:hypothetical protein